MTQRSWARGPVLTHAGSNRMWYCVVWMAPERGFAVLATCNQGGDVAAKACDEVAAALIRRREPGDAQPAALKPPPKSLRLDAFYAKHVDAGGLPIVASARTSDRAVRAAAEIVNGMLSSRPDVRKALVRARVRVAVMSPDEKTTDVPEHRTLTPKEYWDRRARGLGATAARLACSCAEENLLGLAGDRYRGESILVHEFAHTFHTLGLNAVDRSFQKRLDAAYAAALEKGLWEKTYAATNAGEYWAEGVQSWFDANLQADPPDGIHNHVDTRAELEAYDPVLAALVAKAFEDCAWSWSRPNWPSKAPAPEPGSSGD